MRDIVIKIFVALALFITIASLAYREILIREYPLNVRHYQSIMQKISTQEYKVKMLNEYPELKTNRGIPYLLTWLHVQMKYPETNTENKMLNDFRMNNINHEDPITIINFGLGRCGEFTIAFTAILYAQGYDTRMIVDFSPESQLNGNITDGDHMWVEYLYGDWIHIDPTESRINDPLIYERDWGKIVTEVWAITPNFCKRVEECYQYEGEKRMENIKWLRK